MIINITKGVGKGRTKISAFDNALNNAGIANYNLIYLSSIIPTNASVCKQKIEPSKNMGNRLYVVLSHAYVSTPGEWAWAGLGWIVHPNGGIFVEATGECESDINKYIKYSLEDMAEYRSYSNYNIDSEIIGIQCSRTISCALVAAIFQEETWKC